ncbi:MAG: YgjP-like metallopeptidase domain-containing protein [Rikenellaceae bacterium]
MNQLLNKLFGCTKPKAKGGISTYEDPTLGTIIISRSTRARRVSISVKPSGDVRLTIPLEIDPQCALQFIDSRREWIISARERVSAYARPQYTPSQIEELRQRAKGYLPQRCAALAAQHKLQFNKLTIRATRSKWGSCSGQNNISLSIFLMTLPPHLIDFVILHELTHTIHHNHSPRFHAHLNTLLGGREKILIGELRAYRA